jgi:hypothetical protein
MFCVTCVYICLSVTYKGWGASSVVKLLLSICDSQQALKKITDWVA